MASIFFFVALCMAFAYGASNINFLDCSRPRNSWSFWRRCCLSDQLPNDCECFDIWSSDFDNSYYYLPMCPAKLKVMFLYHDRNNRKEPLYIRSGAENIVKTSFRGTRKTVFITHGFTDNATVPWANNMRDALLKAEDLNVILVDWKVGAAPPSYFTAVANTRSVGAMIARLILDLVKYKQASLESFHLVGHSLGAHTSGIAGKEIKRLTGKQLYRITGLDPAGPSFENYNPTVRLDRDDATFVDVIHTDGEPLLHAGFGLMQAIGDVDFYPNGGQHQPGCPPETLGLIGMLSFEGGFEAGYCSHSRVLTLFTDSISLCGYDPKGPCTMGYHCNSHCRGRYNLNTTSEEPFC